MHKQPRNRYRTGAKAHTLLLPSVRLYALFGLTLLFLFFLTSTAYAGPGGGGGSTASIATVLCQVAAWLWGPIGSAVATLAIVAIGLSAMFGKVAIPNVLITMTGIAIIFGAQSIMDNLGLTFPAACISTTASSIINSPLYEVLGCLAKWFNGPLGKSLATIAVLALGLFSMYGRISYHQAIIVSLGIATVMGAGQIVFALGVPVQTAAGGVGLYNLPSGCNGTTSFIRLFCNVIGWFDGPIGKGVASVAVVVLGLGALFGKVGYGLAVVAAVGTALLFGGTTIVDALGAENITLCPGVTDITT